MTALFSLVEEYAALGIHRSGTGTQAATADWLATHLRERGGHVRLEPVEFDRYVADWSVTIDGDEVESLPLFYEATGQASTSTPTTWPAFAPPAMGPMGVSGALDSDIEPGRVVVAATRHLTGLLSVSNRGTALGSGVHVLQVAGEMGGALANGAALNAHIDARTEPATCSNVVATFGDIDAATELTILTTPISGWFQCAGERGTGIAVALDIVERLAEAGPVLFLGATGHELGAFGAAAFHKQYINRVHTLLHIGANVGCDWAADNTRSAPNHSLMPARTIAPDEKIEAISAAFRRVEHGLDTPGRDRSRWFGEAADWLDAPQVLSLLGQNPWFHAPSDLPSVSCTPERTQAVAGAYLEAAVTLISR